MVATILVAEDSLVMRAVLRRHLEHEGYRVVEAVDGQAAIDQCRQARPDTILLDIEMPGLNGHQVLAHLKADDELKDLPGRVPHRHDRDRRHRRRAASRRPRLPEKAFRNRRAHRPCRHRGADQTVAGPAPK
jgi:CheY-like chemotaxis protein